MRGVLGHRTRVISTKSSAVQIWQAYCEEDGCSWKGRSFRGGVGGREAAEAEAQHHAHVLSATRDEARSAVLATFAWTHGHADFARVMRSPGVLRTVGDALAKPFGDANVSAVVAPEARGFVFGALVATAMGVGLVLARKPGSVHPGAVEGESSAPDWRGQRVTYRIGSDAISAGDRLLLVDDWIETGNQARAIAALITRLGGELVGVAAVVDDTDAQTRDELRVQGLLHSHELPADV